MNNDIESLGPVPESTKGFRPLAANVVVKVGDMWVRNRKPFLWAGGCIGSSVAKARGESGTPELGKLYRRKGPTP